MSLELFRDRMNYFRLYPNDIKWMPSWFAQFANGRPSVDGRKYQASVVSNVRNRQTSNTAYAAALVRTPRLILRFYQIVFANKSLFLNCETAVI